MIHRSRCGHGRWIEGLHLIGAKTVFLEPNGEVHHVNILRAGVGGDEVGDEVLFFAGLFAVFVEERFELVVCAHARLHHFGQRPALGVFGGDFEIAADVVRDEFFDVFGALDSEIVAHAGADQNFLDARKRAAFAVELDEAFVAVLRLEQMPG